MVHPKATDIVGYGGVIKYHIGKIQWVYVGFMGTKSNNVG
jgi:hypothetical protein